MDEKRLELLADHYKDTHTVIRSREEQRDRYFLLTVALDVLIALIVLTPSTFQGILKEVEVSGTKVEVTSVPVAVMASLAWTLLLVFLLRCYQAAITIDRQYNYLHDLEDQITPEFGDKNAFRREGRSYKDKKPPLTQWAWLLYTVILPLLLTGVVAHLLYVECKAKGAWNGRYDAPVGAALLVTLLTYVIPQIRRSIERGADARKKKAKQHGGKSSP